QPGPAEWLATPAAAVSTAAIAPGSRCAAGMYAAPTLASSLCLACRRPAVIGLDDARHQFVADHVFMGERDVAHPFDAGEELHRLGKSRGLAVRQVDLAGI